MWSSTRCAPAWSTPRAHGPGAAIARQPDSSARRTGSKCIGRWPSSIHGTNSNRIGYREFVAAGTSITRSPWEDLRSGLRTVAHGPADALQPGQGGVLDDRFRECVTHSTDCGIHDLYRQAMVWDLRQNRAGGSPRSTTSATRRRTRSAKQHATSDCLRRRCVPGSWGGPIQRRRESATFPPC